MATAYRIDGTMNDGNQAELRAGVVQLRREAALLPLGELGRRADALRLQAVRSGHRALARLAGAFSDAVATDGRAAPLSAYLERLEDALDCAPHDGAAGEALLASVSVRLA